MLTGEVRSRIDRIWNDFWSGGIANPLEVMEQITYLLFLKRLDEVQTLAENEQRDTGRSTRPRPFPTGTDAKGRPRADAAGSGRLCRSTVSSTRSASGRSRRWNRSRSRFGPATGWSPT